MREDESLNALVKIFSSVNSPEALKIFKISEEGIRSSTKARKELGITQKQYYVCLKRLIDSGLIEKRAGVYKQTMLGKICINLGNSLVSAISQSDQLELADKLIRSNTLSLKEKEDILTAISTKEMLRTASLSDIIHEVKMISRYDFFIEEVIELLKNAKESVYIVANKTDMKIMEATFEVIDRGLKFFFISSKSSGFSEGIQALRMLLNPVSIKMIRKLITTKELSIRVLENLSHSFIVVDNNLGILELPHPISGQFYVAFKFKNELFGQKLIEVFNLLYEKAEIDPRIDFVKKALGML